MKIILDANIIIAALISDSTARKLIMDDRITFYTAEFVLLEIKKHRNEILRRSKVSEETFDFIYSQIFDQIEVIVMKTYLNRMDDAKGILEQIDVNDSPYFALALSIENDGILTLDKRLKNQDRIKIVEFREVLEYLTLSED